MNNGAGSAFEAERTQFAAQGKVTTTDGHTLRFDVELTMERESVSVSDPAARTDPLVLNLLRPQQRHLHPQISFDAEGNGFLVLDESSDGQVNCGLELFGPRTGQGFEELSGYDADGNGWFDEADPVFSRLRIWDIEGLSTPAEKGAGAIATDSASTIFTIDGGQVRRSGVYLHEHGEAGLVQQIDLDTA